MVEFCKAITESSGHAFWRERTVLHSTETKSNASPVALESISPGKGTYYGTLRSRTLPSKEDFRRQWPAPWIFLSPVQCRTFLLTKGVIRTSCYHIEDDFRLIKIPSHLDRESIHMYYYSKTSNNGPSEKRTTSVQRMAHLPPIDFEPPRSGHLSTPNNGH